MPLTGMALITVLSFMACTALLVLTDYSTMDSTINFVCFSLFFLVIRVKDVIFYFQFVLELVSLVYHFDDVASVFLTHFLSLGSV